MLINSFNGLVINDDEIFGILNNLFIILEKIKTSEE